MTFTPWVFTGPSPGNVPGTLIASSDPFVYSSASSAPVAGVLLLRQLLSQGGTAASFNMAVVGAGAALANTFGCLISNTGVILARTADRSADAALVTANTLWTAPFITPVFIPPGYLYGGILIGSATTLPTFAATRSGTITQALNIGKSVLAGNVVAGNTGAGLTALPASPISIATIGTDPRSVWMGVT